MKKALLMALFILASVSLYITDARAVEWETFLKMSYLNWTEETSFSRREPFVREFGPILSLGGSATFRPTEIFFLRTEAEIFGGLLAYEGESLIDRSFHNSNGARIGGTFEQTLGYKVKISNDFTVSPFAGLGFSAWWRQVCAETWYTGYGKIGIQADYGKFFGKIGLFMPFYSEAHGRWAGIFWLNGGRETKVEVNPKGAITPFAEVGIRQGRWVSSIYFEMKKWEKSDTVDLGGGVHAFQPETTQVQAGVKVGFSF